MNINDACIASAFSSIPMDLRNASLVDGLQIRVGIPHRSGKLAFHAFNHEYPVMVSAAAFWHPPSRTFRIPEATDLSECDTALDSAGFTAMQLWKNKGAQAGIAGVYPWTYADYIELAALLRPSWWAQPDLCCEPELASSRSDVDYRVRATATLLEGTLQIVYEWHNQMARKGWTSRAIANMLPPPVPVLQGWRVEDYLRSLDLLDAVWSRWVPWLSRPSLIGVGSVCRRALHDPTHGLLAIVARLEGCMPPTSRLHLFGVKGAVLNDLRHMQHIASIDSMAYDMRARKLAHHHGVSNTTAHRSAEMTAWMSKAAHRLAPRSGDQLRLGL